MKIGLPYWPGGRNLLTGILVGSISGLLAACSLASKPAATAQTAGSASPGGLTKPERTEFDLRLMVRETYSTNITLTPDKQSDLVTEVNPGISIRRQGARASLNLDYEMQNVFYASNGSGKINNYLTANGNTELVEDHLFLDAYGYVQPQFLSSSGPVGGGGFSPAGFGPVGGGSFSPSGQQFLALNDNQTTAASFGLRPSWRQNLGRYATMQARYDSSFLNYTQTEGGSAPSNARNNNVNLALNSGPYFSVLEWDVQYDNQGLGRDTAQNNTYESTQGRFRHRLNNKWALVGRAGYEDNDVPGQDVVNGGYWSLGPEWTPSRYLSVAALYGTRDWLARLRFNPTIRTALELERSNTQVGVNPGNRWSGTLSHRTRHTTWSASYFEETTTVQGVQFSQLVTVGQNQPLTPQPVFTLTDQDFLQKNFQATVTYQKGRSDVTLGLFNERREYADAADNQTALGAGLAWGWRFSPRTRMILGGQWQQDDSTDDSQNQWWVGSCLVEYNLSRYISALWGYRYYQQELYQDNVQENRLQLGLQAQF